MSHYKSLLLLNQTKIMGFLWSANTTNVQNIDAYVIRGRKKCIVKWSLYNHSPSLPKNIDTVQIKSLLNANSNFLNNCWCYFTLGRLSWYVVFKNLAIVHLLMIYVAKDWGTSYYFKLYHVGCVKRFYPILTAGARDKGWFDQ